MAYGSVNADVITTSTAGGVLGAGNASIMKNRIINGAMVINQRGASGVPANGAYTLDRWQSQQGGGGAFSVEQSSTAPTGFTNSLLATVTTADSSIAATDYYIVSQAIEGFNTADLGWGASGAKTVTLSFWVRSSLTGTFGGALNNSATNYSYPFTYTISSANTWTQASVTIAGPTAGTWLTTNGAGIRVHFGLGLGSQYSGTVNTWASTEYYSATGAVSPISTVGATFYITGVQLEVGSSATGFEYENYTSLLTKCQRYFYSLGGTASYEFIGTGNSNNTNSILVMVTMPIKMRSAPTFTTVGNFLAKSNGSNVSVSSITTDQAGSQTFSFSATATATTGQGIVMFTDNSTSARFNLSAEL